LIDANGGQVGVVSIDDALRRAEEAQLDLVEVAPTAQPPVCRILDYGKFKYQLHKKEAEAKRKATTTTVKELRLGYRTDTGDMERQIARARGFLEAGDRVKFILRFRGREMAYQDLGRQKLLGVCNALKDAATVEGNPRMEGRMMNVILMPSKKKAAKPPKDEPKSPKADSKPPKESQPSGEETKTPTPASSEQ
jgi:translation initiation factor IF-3